MTATQDRVLVTLHPVERKQVAAEPVTAEPVAGKRPTMLGDGLAMALTAGTSALVGMASWVFVAHHLPTAEVGRAAAFVSGFLLVSGCTDLNLGVGVLRWLPRAGTRTVTIVVRCLAATVAMTAAVAVAYLLLPGSGIVLEAAPGSSDSPLLAAACFVGACVAWAVFQQQDFTLAGLGRAWWAPARIGAFAVARAVVLVGGAMSATLVVWSWLAPAAVCVLLTAGASLVLARRPRGAAVEGHLGLPPRREVLGFLGPTYVGHIGLGLLFYLVPLVATIRFGPALGAPFFLVWQAVVVVDVVSQYFVTSLATAVAREPGRAAEHVRDCRRRLLMLVVPALVVGIPLSGPVLSVFGPDYAVHSGLLALMLVGTILRLWVITRLGEHQALGRGVRYAVISLANTAGVVALVALVPAGTAVSWKDPLMPIAVGYVLLQALVAAATTVADRGNRPSPRPRGPRPGSWVWSAEDAAPAGAPRSPGDPAHTPAVSVCVPVYKGEDHLAATIESVLAQTFSDFELVVLDNASPDRSAEIAASYDDPRIRIETNPVTLPLTENWNTAVRHARAPLVKLLCDDDLLHPRCLELQVGALRSDQELAVVASRQHLVDGRERLLVPGRFLRGLLGPRSRAAVVRRVVRSGANPFGAMCGVMFRRSAFDATRGFEGERVFVADTALIVSLTRHGGFLGQQESLAAYRVVSSSVLASAKSSEYEVQKNYMQELRREPGGRVRPVDVAFGWLAGPWGRLRRQAAFLLAARVGGGA